MDVAALVVSVAAALIAAAGAVAAIRARHAAERSATAAERSAAAAERSNELLTPGVGTEDVRWIIEWASATEYRLVNVGTSTATGVTVDPGALPDELRRRFPVDASIDPNDGLRFLIAKGYAPSSLVVTWDGAGDDVHRVPLPPG